MVARWKFEEVKELTKRISRSKVIALVNIGGIPSRQLQLMRKRLKGKAELRVGKNNLIKMSFERAGIKDLDKHVRGSVGLIFTDLDPFKLNKILKSSRVSAPAKAGSIAPKDIVVPSGDTSLPAGPIIGDLQRLGIKARIQEGRIIVTEDSLVVRKGEEISRDMAGVLTRLGIEPIEIGLELNAAYEDGVIYTSDILDIDETKTISDLQSSYRDALNLALNSGIYNSVTIKYLLNDAFNSAINLTINAEIPTRETIRFLLSKANREMLSLKSRISGDSVSGAPAGGEDEREGEPKKEVEGEEEKTEDEAASGLASLFG